MSDDEAIERILPFPYEGDEFPRSLGAVVQRTVADGTEPAREVIHAADGSWLVGDGINDPNESGASVAIHMAHVVAQNSSVAELANLPLGTIAWRSQPGDDWKRAAHIWPIED